MKIVILGNGRFGSYLANRLDQAGHNVIVIDRTIDNFNRLSSGFRGKTVIGNGVDEDTLKRANIENADAFIAVTNGDNRNIMAAQLAKEVFHVKQVICGIRDPARGELYKNLGMEIISSTAFTSQRLYDALLSPTTPTSKETK
ncbi:MAG TPA: TrkA family potassium uptake protein [Ktedonobacteraceae bacterium]|jgi:trk system potassium uptake protein TrkA|nr:TrkA family potassium uptake protein [Ktedonobacteraceae bacterium]